MVNELRKFQIVFSKIAKKKIKTPSLPGRFFI